MPSDQRTVTMTPAMSTPIEMERKEGQKLNLERTAIIEPVQAPVIGRGMQTKMVSPA